MAVGGGRRGIQHTGSHPKAGAHARGYGIVENGIVARRVGSPVHMVVVYLLTRGEGCAAGRRVGAVVVARVGARETAVGEPQESRIVAYGAHHRGIDLGHSHAVANDKNHIAGHLHLARIRNLFLAVGLLLEGLQAAFCRHHRHTPAQHHRGAQKHSQHYLSNFHIDK